MFSYVHLHVHSIFSFGDGPDPPEALCEAAVRGGQTALALTDTNGLYGAVRFAVAARAAGLRPILGAQLKAGRNRAVLLPLDSGGLVTLLHLIRRLHAEGDFDLRSALVHRGPGLAVLTDDEALLGSVLAGRGAEDLYVEVWPRGRAPRARRERLRELALRAGIPAVATGGVHFARRSGHPLHRCLRALSAGCNLGALPPSASAPPDAWLWPTERMAQGFEDHPELLANAAALAERCRAELPLLGLRPYCASNAVADGVPPVGVPDAVTGLRERCERAAALRWGAPLPRPARLRLRQELDLLSSSGLSPAVLALGELAHRARQAAIPVVARGSAAGSLVLHLLGLAPVDPLRHDLGFARFFEAGRATPPDVDLDVGWRDRHRLLALAREQLGDRGTVRAGRLVSWQLTGERLARAGVEAAAAAFLQGLPERLTAHPSALALLPGPAEQLVPMEPAGPDGEAVSQWDGRALRRTGLLLVDLLGNRALSVVHDLSGIRDGGGDGDKEPSADLRPTPPTTPRKLLRDPQVQALVREGRTLGCYHLESPPQRRLLRRLGTTSFDTLMAAVALVRPGAEGAGMTEQLVQRARSTAGWRAARRPLLVYQDDLLEVVRRRAGFSREEAEQLCGVLRRPGGAERQAVLRARFLQACLDHGEAPADAHALWDQVATFAGASFCKAHCAASVALGLRGAWQRAHHPADFLAAVLAQGAGYYPRSTYLSEARRLGLTLLGPCVNRSADSFQGHDSQIRLGLAQIRGLGVRAVEAVLEARALDGPFEGEADLARRARLTPRELDLLLRSGALPRGGLQGRDRAGLMLPLETPPDRSASDTATPPPPELRPKLLQILRQEMKTFGFLLSGHPLDLVAQQLPPGIIQAEDLDRYRDAPVALAGWLVCLKHIMNRAGQPMAFATFEDQSDLFDAQLEPALHARFGAALDQSPGPYVVYGQVAGDPGAHTVRLRELVPL